MGSTILIRREDPPPDSEFSPELEAHLDGRLDGEHRTAFERTLDDNPAARAAHDESRRIDDGISRLFRVPHLDVLPRAVEAHERRLPSARRQERASEHRPPVRRARTRRGFRWMALAGASCMAAVFVAAALVVVPEWRRVRSAATTPAAPRDPATLYASLVQDGFVPSMKCDDDAEFARYTTELYGESFLVPESDRMRVIGWAYGREVAGMDSGIILCRVDNAPVVVLVGRREADRPIAVPPTSGLTAHRRELGEVVMYELTPHAEAEVIPRAVLVGEDG